MGSQRVRYDGATGLDCTEVAHKSVLSGVTALRPLPGGVAATGLGPRVTVTQHALLQVRPASRAVPVLT